MSHGVDGIPYDLDHVIGLMPYIDDRVACRSHQDGHSQCLREHGFCTEVCHKIGLGSNPSEFVFLSKFRDGSLREPCRVDSVLSMAGHDTFLSFEYHTVVGLVDESIRLWEHHKLDALAYDE